MTPLSFLQGLASDAVLRPSERERHARSVQSLEERLAKYFGDEIVDAFPFGSSVRGTSLPQVYSDAIDIDYIVVFQNDGHRPRTYLERLLGFAREGYPRSPVRRSTPAVVIELSHITFELVPALAAFWNDYKIPTVSGEWRGANPSRLEQEIIRLNQHTQGLLKPAIRLAKLWNAAAGYVFDSFELERQACGGTYRCANVRDCFFAIVQTLSLDLFDASWRHDELKRARQAIRDSNRLETLGRSDDAVRILESLFNRRGKQ